MIDEKQALALLEEVVEAHGPETTYDQRCKEIAVPVGTGCTYVSETDDPKPLCLIGVLLVEKCGVGPSEFLGKVDKWLVAMSASNDSLNTKSVRMLQTYAPHLVAGFTPRALAVLTEAQAMQDAQRTWGQALDAAKTFYDAVTAPAAVLV